MIPENSPKSEKQKYLERSKQLKQELIHQICRLGDYLEEGKTLSEFEPHRRKQLKKVAGLLMHSHGCSSSRPCYYPKCRIGMALNAHVLTCKQASVCKLCKSMARFVFLPPRCIRDMKEHRADRGRKRNEGGLIKQLHLMRIKEEIMNTKE